MELKEYQKRIAYQIYPASFKDSNNDGWGDIQGIISKLDYLKDLGIGMIWLSPIYASPMDDMGYDISDYKAINPRFGTMEDFDELIAKADELDIKIVMDLVINHTSTEHEWFKAACKDRDSRYRYYYIIEKGTKHRRPNNWDSCFSGPAWKKMPGSKDEYYMHLFCDTQADLNYKNHIVVEEVKDIIKFWLDKGVYGFRCDVINCLYKTSLANDKRTKLFGKGEKFYFNQPGFFDVMKEIREDVLDHYDTFLLGETSHIDPEMGKMFIKERVLDTFFEFDHLHSYQKKLPVFKRKFSPKILMTELKKWQENSDWMSNYLENHDQLRSISCLGDESHPFESGSLLATLLLTLRGTPFIYQGEEIGTLNDKNVTMYNTNDICAKTAQGVIRHSIPFIGKKRAFKMVNQTIHRDHARKPMMFDDTVNGGFNEGHETWIGVNEQYKTTNVKAQLEDNNSLLSFYKQLITFRKTSDVLTMGDIKFEYISNDVNTFLREFEGKMYLIVLNFSNKTKSLKNNRNLNLLFSNYKENVPLYAIKPYFAGIFEVLKEGEIPTTTWAPEPVKEEPKDEAETEVKNEAETEVNEETKVLEETQEEEQKETPKEEIEAPINEQEIKDEEVKKEESKPTEDEAKETKEEVSESIQEDKQETSTNEENDESLKAPQKVVEEKEIEEIHIVSQIPEGNLKAPEKEKEEEPMEEEVKEDTEK